jgi:HSP20 family protein
LAKKSSGKRGSILFVQRQISQMDEDLASEASGLIHAEKFYQPRVDIYETEDSLRIEIEIPGVMAKDIELYSIQNKVSIKVNKYDLTPLGGLSSFGKVNFICMERKFGWFQREINLPITCNAQQARATYRHGVLILEIPRILDRRGRRVDIPIEEDES